MNGPEISTKILLISRVKRLSVSKAPILQWFPLLLGVGEDGTLIKIVEIQ